jgi:uncharacterized protein (TIGR02391 family)
MLLAYRRFREVGLGARIGSEDLERDLGMDRLRQNRTHELVQWLPGIGGGQSSAPNAWYRDVTADITRFKRVETVEGLLATLPGFSRVAAPPSNRRAPGRPTTGPADDDLGLSLSVANLHPSIVVAAGALFRDGHYAPAAFQALKAVEVRLRELSGLDLSGRDLMAQALSGNPPRVTVSRHPGRTGDDEQEGLRFILMGVMQGLRNPGGHELNVLDRDEALEELAIASLLMRWLDTSRRKGNVNEAATRGKGQSRAPARPRQGRPESRRLTADPRVTVLTELVDMSHKQARTSAILDLQLQPLSASSGIAIETLQDALVDILAEGLAEPYAPTLDQSAEQGACRITGAGVRELSRMRAGDASS